MARYTAAMINIRPLIEQRLKTLSDFREVAGVSDLVTLLAGRLATPGCYIYPLNNSATNHGADSVIGFEEEQFAVVLAVKNVRDSRGADASDQCFSLRDTLLTTLQGWQPDPQTLHMRRLRGQFLKLVNGHYLWMDVYKTGQYTGID